MTIPRVAYVAVRAILYFNVVITSDIVLQLFITLEKGGMPADRNY